MASIKAGWARSPTVPRVADLRRHRLMLAIGSAVLWAVVITRELAGPILPADRIAARTIDPVSVA